MFETIFSLINFVLVKSLKFYGSKCAVKTIAILLLLATTPPPSPKPRYSVTDFVGQLCSTIESIIDCETNPIFLITGDFNSLATDFLEEDLILG